MLVSVITSTYNRADLLEETIESVLNQDYPNIEYIVLDDGSSDNTPELMEKYSGKLTYVRHQNMGENKTVNVGYRMCKGDLVCVLNSDDPFCSAKAVSMAVKCFVDRPHVLGVYPDWQSIDINGKVIKEFRLPDYDIEKMLVEFNCFQIPGMFIRKSFLESIGWRDESLKYTGELDVLFKLALSKGLHHLPHIIATHRIHAEPASSTSSTSSTCKSDVMGREAFRLVTEAFKYPEQLPQSCIARKYEIYRNAAQKAFKEFNDSLYLRNSSMSALHLSSNDRLGSRFNGYELGRYLREKNISSLFCVFQKLDESYFDILPDYADNYSYSYFPTDNKFLGDIYYKKCSETNQRYNSQALFYEYSYRLLFDRHFLTADVLHLHLIHNYFFDINHLPILSRLKPLVWTLHDPWLLTGHCVHPYDCERWKTGCGNCPHLDIPFAINADTTALNWEYKKTIIAACELDLIVASKWMYDRVIASPLFDFDGKHRLHLVPFGLDLDRFCPTDMGTARKRLGIAPDCMVLALRATDSEWKGLPYIKECLRSIKYSGKVTLITFNDRGLLEEFRDRYEIIEIGVCLDDDKMVNAFNAADIFLMPSTAESFGMMTMEAMACGKPCIVMDGTALPEVLKAEEGTGIVVPQGDVAEMTRQLEILLKSPEKMCQMGKNARAVAEKYYAKNRYTDAVIKVYEKAVEQKKNDSRSKYIVEQQKKILPSSGDTEEDFNHIIGQYGYSEFEFMVLKILRRFVTLPVLSILFKYLFCPAFIKVFEIARSIFRKMKKKR